MDEQKQCNNCGKELTKVAIRQSRSRGFEYKEIGICSKCAKKIVPKPFFDEDKKLLWKNIILPDIQSFVMIMIVLIMFWAFKHDVAVCQDAVKNPCTFCATTGCYNPKTKCSYSSDIDLPEQFDTIQIIDYKKQS